MTAPPDEPLWAPSPHDAAIASLTAFWRLAEERTGQTFPDYAALHRWSIEESGSFWMLLAEFADVEFDQPPREAKGPDRMPGTEWFPGARLNVARNMLRRRDDHVALIARTESGHTQRLTYAELYACVARAARALRAAGVGPGDRVAGFLVNGPEAVVAFLAAAMIGATWSSCSPDFGPRAALDRLGQIGPKVLVASDRYEYGGKPFDVRRSVRKLAASIETLERVVVAPYEGRFTQELDDGWQPWQEFIAAGSQGEAPFVSLPFDHPLYILFSSGTTGEPKCMVHGAGGTLLQHRKEHLLHSDLGEEDVLVYFTTCGWMMWNWLVSALAGGSTLVLYEGSPAYPSFAAPWRMVEDLGITAFGTSAAFIEASMREGGSPRRSADLSSLRSVLSTGSPLAPSGFRWVSEHVGERVRLASISGGTDIVSCFMLGNPLLPVHAGEIQCLGLGMDVVALDDHGAAVVGAKGELVCRRPFPSMPVRFWNDPDGRKYHAAYFAEFEGMWRHGDFIEITERGGIVIYGRSDATLNPGGVRIGTAEIYRPLQALPWIVEALAAGYGVGASQQIVLFVVPRVGEDLTDEREREIRTILRRDASPRHVPKWIFAVADIPKTRNGKVAELAVRRVLHGEQIPNRDTLANPECLAEFEPARDALTAAPA